MKPGFKTSEFWINFLVFILGALLASGLIADGGDVARAVGGILSLFSALGYTTGRVGVKKADAVAVAYVKAKEGGPPDPNSSGGSS